MDVTVEIQWVWASFILGFVLQMLALAGLFFRAGGWTSRVDAERTADREARAKEVEATEKALAEIKATLGNGAPGTVVRTTVCEALHAGVEQMIGAVHEDIRSLHTAVRDLRSK